MDKEIVVYINNGILFTLKKIEFLPFVTIWMKPGGHYATRNKPDTERKIPNDLTYM